MSNRTRLIGNARRMCVAASSSATSLLRSWQLQGVQRNVPIVLFEDDRLRI
jgi:hypothetical protein